MSSEVVIHVENLSKKYILGKNGVRTEGLRHVIHNLATAPLRWLRGRSPSSVLRPPSSDVRPPSSALRPPSPSRTAHEDFWALKNVSFEVKRGEVVGIIGRNGAGKSTLLKILSRITEPTTGRVRIKGRVASLLEVGTGFHPELTGRENIFLNGAILGMRRREISQKLDEIIAFSEVEQFLDTPVKRYSSGMYLRLAFAVAAHLEPEILIVDEVLAVGDAEFQKKCLGKMNEVGRGGRTVLFVSHNVSALGSLCQSGLLLTSGMVGFRGEIGQAIELYSRRRIGDGDGAFPKFLCDELTLAEFKLIPNPIKSGGALSYRLSLHSTVRVRFDGLAILIYSSQGVRVGVIDLRQVGTLQEANPSSPLKIAGTVILPNLIEGDYSFGLYVSCSLVAQNFMDLLVLCVTQEYDEGSIGPYAAAARGLVEFKSCGASDKCQLE